VGPGVCINLLRVRGEDELRELTLVLCAELGAVVVVLAIVLDRV